MYLPKRHEGRSPLFVEVHPGGYCEFCWSSLLLRLIRVKYLPLYLRTSDLIRFAPRGCGTGETRRDTRIQVGTSSLRFESRSFPTSAGGSLPVSPLPVSESLDLRDALVLPRCPLPPMSTVSVPTYLLDPEGCPWSRAPFRYGSVSGCELCRCSVGVTRVVTRSWTLCLSAEVGTPCR